jgi:hypothetical protein
MMNVHHASLFPDLLGASEYCNNMVSQLEVDLRQSEISQKATLDPPVAESTTDKSIVPATAAEALSIRQVLSSPAEASGVEPARLELIAQELATELLKQQSVDWRKRDNVKAAMRNSARVVLRRLGYPAVAREAVLDQLLGALGSNT